MHLSHVEKRKRKKQRKEEAAKRIRLERLMGGIRNDGSFMTRPATHITSGEEKRDDGGQGEDNEGSQRKEGDEIKRKVVGDDVVQGSPSALHKVMGALGNEEETKNSPDDVSVSPPPPDHPQHKAVIPAVPVPSVGITNT